jgi:ABC-2 type transport system ATP-binding protein
LFDLPAEVRKIRIEALLDMVGLKAVANRAVGTFSKGMARRIGLAQALINDPDLLILDEPTTGLDPIGTRQIKDLILQLAKRGKTILLSSHLLADVEDICDRIAILYGGKVQAEGRVKELLQQTDKRQITTGYISDTAVERIRQIVQDENSDCVVSSPMDRLETFFINTIATAQQQAPSISGAVSTTGITDFLASVSAEESQRAAVLDKLVSAPTLPQSPPEMLRSERVGAVESSEPKPDEQLLRKLAEGAKPAKSEPVVKTEPVEHNALQQQQVQKDILDQLTGRLIPRDEDKKQTPDKQGDTSDA